MKISVFGQGKLGVPIANVLQGSNITVARVDPAQGYNDMYGDSDAHAVIVPTPSGEDGKFVNTFVESVLQQLSRLKNDSPVILLSTVMPGSCRELQSKYPQHPIFYSPQFVDLGHVEAKFRRPDFILIGFDEKGSFVEQRKGLQCVNDMYKNIISASAYSASPGHSTKANSKYPPMFTMNWESAETAKLALNNFLAMKLDFVNLIQGFCMAENIDYKPVFEMLRAEPRIGNQFMSPGFGHGGPCLTRDQRALNAITDINLLNSRDALTDSVVSQCGDKVLVLGVTYKPDVRMVEDSHVCDVIEKLLEQGKPVDFYDPMYRPDNMDGWPEHLAQATSLIRIPDMSLSDYDTVIIGVPYSDFNLDYADKHLINLWGTYG